MKHFFASASTSNLLGVGSALDLGEDIEKKQEKHIKHQLGTQRIYHPI
jgi:hypothetical protein